MNERDEQIMRFLLWSGALDGSTPRILDATRQAEAKAGGELLGELIEQEARWRASWTANGKKGGRPSSGLTTKERQAAWYQKRKLRAKQGATLKENQTSEKNT